MIARYEKYLLKFKRPSGTSRGVLHTKETYLLTISETDRQGIGECALFRGLSCDDVPDYKQKLGWLCQNINENPEFLHSELKSYPSIWFGYEQAMRNLQHGADLYFPGEFTNGNASIKINGLIWMGDTAFVERQLEEKLRAGFDCIKMKIGVDWQNEKKILQKLREKYPKNRLELRVDANGAFNVSEAENVLEELSDLGIHSIEQPIQAGNTEDMAKLRAKTRTPIALDEELIGVVDSAAKKTLLEKIKPQYIILKPALVGGFSGTDEWISLAEKLGIGWWITSALESNIGLNAIAQYTSTKNPKMPQGLGTGGLFTNNFATPLLLEGDLLKFKK